MTTTDALQLTEHEVLALLSFNEGEPTAITRDIFRLTPQAGNEEFTKAGMTTLLVRDLAEIKDSDIIVKGPAEFLAAVMATAGEWLEIALVTPKTNHVMFAVSSAGGAFVANVNGNGTHSFTPLKNEEPILGFGIQAAAHYLTDSEGNRPVAAQIKHHGFGVEPKTANLMVDETGAWQLAKGEGTRATKESVPAGEALELFERALDLDEGKVRSE